MEWHYHIETKLGGRIYSTTQRGWGDVRSAEREIRAMRRDPERRRNWSYRTFTCLDDCANIVRN